MILGIAQLGKVARNLNPLSQPAVSARDFEKALTGVKQQQFKDFQSLQSHVLKNDSGITPLGRQWLARANRQRMNERVIIRQPEGNTIQTAEQRIAEHKSSAMKWLRHSEDQQRENGIAADLAKIADYQQRLDYRANMTAGLTTLGLGVAGAGAWTLLNKSDD